MTSIKILFRGIFKNKVTSIIAVTGFSVSISMALIMIAFIIGEYSVDKSYPNINRIYRVFANDDNASASVREDLREFFLENYPAVKDACRYNNYLTTLTFDDQPFSGNMIATDTSFFNIFSTRFITGNNASLVDPGNVVLTESFARNIFGDQDPLGKILTAEYATPLVVSGVVKDFPERSSIKGDFFTNSNKKIKYEGWDDGMGNQVNYFRMFIFAAIEEEHIPELVELMTADVTKLAYKTGFPITKIRLTPFSESYFSQVTERSHTTHANLKLIKILLVVCSIIILLAIFNYVNLTTASHTDRFKEIGIKKTIGAGRPRIFKQFMLESLLICLISFLFAVYLSSFFVTFFERFLGRSIDLLILYNPSHLIWLITGVLALTLISGIYPALSISRLRPILILSKMNSLKNNSFGLRAILNILQNAVSVTLIISLIILSKQIDYVRTKDYGFETDKLLRVDVHWRLESKTSLIRDKLLSDPAIRSVCFTHGSPGSIYSYSSWSVNESENRMNQLSADSAFFNVFRIPIVMGREALPSDFGKVCYINETAFRTAGWETYEGQKYHGMEIIGVVRDFHFSDMYNRITPLAIQLTSGMGISHMSLRVANENIPGIIRKLQETWKEVCPGHELKYQFYDEWLDSMYKSEEKLTSAISLFAVLAIMISCLGIIGLADFAIRKRIKEIGIRKVNGARISGILLMLNGNFVRWSVIAFVIAVPSSWFIMNSWLENFAYRTTMDWWVFVAAGIISTVIGLFTVSWQSWKAATRNPIDSLRYE